MCPKPQKAICLLSGGLDSALSLAEGALTHDVCLALTFDYGQRAIKPELTAAQALCKHYNVTHKSISLPWLRDLLPETLDSESNHTWDTADEKTLLDVTPVWVPNRNGVFLSIAAAFAESLKADVILFGGNLEEAQHFPDNTEAFREAMTKVFHYSTLSHPTIVCPVGHLYKTAMVERALELNVPLHLVWSCYDNQPQQCGQCPSCLRLKQALQQVTDTSTPVPTFIH